MSTSDIIMTSVICSGIGVFAVIWIVLNFVSKRREAAKKTERDKVWREEQELLRRREYQRVSETGTPREQYEYALYCLHCDSYAAVELFEKAAASGNEAALETLGNLYMYGNAYANPPLKADIREAVRLFTPLAESGNAEAMKNLGFIYSADYDDEEKFVYWYKKAAGSGDSESMVWLGKYYLYDKKQPEEAEKWFKKAAGLGDEVAEKYLSENFG